MVKLPDEQERLVVAALGESGEGKSALLNLLLNSPGEHKVYFPESEEPEPCTLQARTEQGLWRGDPGRPLTVLDTPGLGAGNEDESDEKKVQDVLRMVQEMGGLHAFIVVMRAGQSRFLSTHQLMLRTFQKVLGEQFWANCIFDVSHSCDSRNKKNFESWMNRMSRKFPSAHEENPPKVFVDTELLENDTLEELYELCRGKMKYQCEDGKGNQVPKLQVHSSMEDLSVSLGEELSSRQDEVPQCSSRSSTSMDNHPDLPSTNLNVPRKQSKADFMLPPRSPCMILDMPSLPPRSPRSRRRTLPSYSVSSTSTPRLSRPLYSPTEDHSSPYTSYSATCTPRQSRRSYTDNPSSAFRRSCSRDPSPSSYSYRSRSPSPVIPSSSSSSSSFQTIGLPTYLRTCNAYSKPFTKAMRAGRLLLKHAEEEDVSLESTKDDIAPLPSTQHCTVLPANFDINLCYVTRSGFEFSPVEGRLCELETQTHSTERVLHTLVYQQCHRVAPQHIRVLDAEKLEEVPEFVIEEVSFAKKITEPKTSLELMKPDSLVMRNDYKLVKKALLPKIKYHWDQGFKQGPNGWQKCPVIKLKFKYHEEDQELLPPALSVEGGAQCETKQVKLEAGKAKTKLRAEELKPVQLRVVPLDKSGKQEAFCPEFLFTVEKITGEEIGADKWWKAVVTPALPE